MLLDIVSVHATGLAGLAIEDVGLVRMVAPHGVLGGASRHIVAAEQRPVVRDGIGRGVDGVELADPPGSRTWKCLTVLPFSSLS
jgi:hypothetical protein